MKKGRKTPEELSATDLGPCPQCGRRVSGSLSPEAVMHELPTCVTFEQLDALSFVTWMRERTVGPLGNA